MAKPTQLLRHEFVELDLHYTEKVVVLRRTTRAFDRVSDVEGTVEAMARCLPAERRKGLSVILDNREAPIRTDPSLEPAFARYRAETERSFERCIVVAASPVGKLRADRLAKSTQIPVIIVSTLDAAWALLKPL